jgi:hypothetical protein
MNAIYIQFAKIQQRNESECDIEKEYHPLSSLALFTNILQRNQIALTAQLYHK